MSETLIHSGPVTVMTDVEFIGEKVVTLHALIDDQKNKLVGIAYLTFNSADFFNSLDCLKRRGLRWVDSAVIPKDISALSFTPEVLQNYLQNNKPEEN